ncbi:MAG: FixH family protein [Ignavibacteriae bacterium]|nr:FixH family protein [Ignavibacteriota bacterium]
MSWGTKIILSFVVFMTGMLAMVFYVFNLKMDLVEDNYYEQDLKYQEHINTLEKTLKDRENLQIVKKAGSIDIQFPEQGSTPGGEIFFYRPSDAGKDFKINISPDVKRMQNVSTSNLDPGIWKIQVTWYSDNQKYYKEERVFID